MRRDGLSTLLAALAALLGGIVVFTEASYLLSHARPGPAAHILLCGAGVVLLAAAVMARNRNP